MTTFLISALILLGIIAAVAALIAIFIIAATISGEIDE